MILMEDDLIGSDVLMCLAWDKICCRAWNSSQWHWIFHSSSPDRSIWTKYQFHTNNHKFMPDHSFQFLISIFPVTLFISFSLSQFVSSLSRTIYISTICHDILFICNICLHLNANLYIIHSNIFIKRCLFLDLAKLIKL